MESKRLNWWLLWQRVALTIVGGGMVLYAIWPWLPCLPLLQTRIRQGGPDEIWREAQEGDYEIVVMGQK